jgi:PAS domain S-box-containing protein
VNQRPEDNPGTAQRAEPGTARAGATSGTLDLDAVFPALPALLFLFDRDDRYLDFRAGEDLFVPPDQFLGRRIDEVLPADTAVPLREAMARARTTAQRQTVAYSLLIDGTVRHFEARVSALSEGRSAVLCLDRTEQHAAEEAARQRERTLAHLTSVVPTVVYGLRVTPEGVEIGEVSANLERVLGYAAEQIRQPGWWAAQVHPDDRASAVEGVARARLHGHVTHVYRFRHADGSYRWLRDQLRVVRDEPGRPVEIAGAFSDVTAEREAQDRARQSDDRLRALMERSSDLVMVFDERGTITFASPSSEQVLGIPASELVDHHGFEYLHPDDVTWLAPAFERLATDPSHHLQAELRVRHRDGSWRLFAISGRNLLQHPAVRGVVVNNREITEERRLAQQVLQVQKLESVGRLAGGVAHDFNNLLTGILGYAEMLAQDIRDGRPNLADVEEIRRAGERARDLTRQLLAFARRQVNRPVVLDLRTAVRDAENLLRRVLGEDVHLHVLPGDTPLPVRIDPTHLQQVVLNLAVNARDAMPGGGTLTLETSRVELDQQYADSHPSVSSGPHAMLAVTDSGEGMSDEARSHLFEPFFTTKPAGVGTGLGLAPVYGIVKQAGGNIWVYSEPGRGTTFKIYFPVSDEAPGIVEPPAPRPPAQGKETVLVVEDDAAVRALAVRALESAGYHVLPANGGEAAMALAARTGSIDLLLTDVVLGGMSGKHVADTLRGVRPGLRVLYVSGYTQNTIVHHGVLDPGVEFLAKPFTPTVLLHKVRQVLDR